MSEGKSMDQGSQEIKGPVRFIRRFFHRSADSSVRSSSKKIQERIKEYKTIQEKEREMESRKKAEAWFDKTAFSQLVTTISAELTAEGRSIHATRYTYEQAPLPTAYTSIVFDKKEILQQGAEKTSQGEKEVQIFCDQNGTIRIGNHSEETVVFRQQQWIDSPLVQEQALRGAIVSARHFTTAIMPNGV